MQWITLIGDEKLNLSIIKAIEHYGSINCYDLIVPIEEFIRLNMPADKR